MINNYIQKDFLLNSKNEIISFYKELNMDGGVLSVKDILRLKKASLSLSPILLREDLPYAQNYLYIMNKIKTSSKRYNITKSIEKYILFMFSVDPDFDAYIIHECSNKKEELIEKLIDRFGVYDPFLSIIEKFYINEFLGITHKNEIREKIASKII